MTNDNKTDGITDIDDVNLSRNSINTGIERVNNKVKTIFVILGLLILFAGLVMTIFNFDSKDQMVQVKKDEALKETSQIDTNSLAAQMLEIKQQQEEKERRRLEEEEKERLRREKEEQEALARKREEDELLAKITPVNPMPVGDGSIQNVGEGMSIEQRRLSGETMVLLDSIKLNAEKGNTINNDGGLNEMLGGGIYKNGSAIVMNNNRSLLLIHGTQIPCGLQTRLVTDQPSILICQITKDIYSADGSTVLIERGSKVLGEQKKAIITGQNMAFVNWSTIDTPHGVRIRVDSLGTDSLGASGTSVWVDEKWGKRFGSSIMLSFIQDALSSASNAASNNNSSDTVVYENSERNSGRMAEIALENSINIQPTGYANQGQLVNILVVRDIDFADTYTLSKK